MICPIALMMYSNESKLSSPRAGQSRRLNRDYNSIRQTFSTCRSSTTCSRKNNKKGKPSMALCTLQPKKQLGNLCTNPSCTSKTTWLAQWTCSRWWRSTTARISFFHQLLESMATRTTAIKLMTSTRWVPMVSLN